MATTTMTLSFDRYIEIIDKLAKYETLKHYIINEENPTKEMMMYIIEMNMEEKNEKSRD